MRQVIKISFFFRCAICCRRSVLDKMLHIESFQMNIFWYIARKTATTRANWVLNVSIVERTVIKVKASGVSVSSSYFLEYLYFGQKSKNIKRPRNRQ